MMPKTLLIVPTYRYSKQAIATLTYISCFCDEFLHLVISDCSQNTIKHERLSVLETQSPYTKIIYRAERTLLYKDVSDIILNNQNYDYIGIFPDDDLVTLEYIEQSIEILKSNAEIVCSYGNYLIQSTNGNIFKDTREALEPTATQRLQNGFNPNYFNTMFFALFKASSLKPWAEFSINHPLPSSFFDFIHCVSLMAQGPIKCHTKGYLLWEAINWDQSYTNSNTRERYYCQVGLPNFTIFHDLHFAVEGVNFFLGPYIPSLAPEVRQQCASVFWQICMNRFRQTSTIESTQFHKLLGDQGLFSLNFLISAESFNYEDMLKHFCILIAAFDKKIADTYFTHFHKTVQI